MQRFYHMLSSMYSGLLLMTEEGRVEFVNQAFCDAYGLKRRLLTWQGCLFPTCSGRSNLPSPILTRLLPDSGKSLERRTGQGRGIRHAGRADGGAGFYPRTVNGKSSGGSGYHTDITERKAMERALQKAHDDLEQRVIERTEQLVNSEKEFRLLAEAMPQIVWITRADGWNIYFNQQWVDYTGLTLEESYGHGWNKPFHPDDRQRAWDAWQNAVTNNGTYSLNAVCGQRTGHIAGGWSVACLL